MNYVPNHSAIIVSNAQASAAFYEKALGFQVQVIRRPTDTTCSVFMRSPSGNFLLQLLETGAYLPEFTGYGHFSASVDDIHAAHKIHAEIECATGEIMDLGYQLCYFIKDLDGYETEIIQYKNNKGEAL